MSRLHQLVLRQVVYLMIAMMVRMVRMVMVVVMVMMVMVVVMVVMIVVMVNWWWQLAVPPLCKVVIILTYLP